MPPIIERWYEPDFRNMMPQAGKLVGIDALHYDDDTWAWIELSTNSIVGTFKDLNEALAKNNIIQYIINGQYGPPDWSSVMSNQPKHLLNNPYFVSYSQAQPLQAYCNNQECNSCEDKCSKITIPEPQNNDGRSNCYWCGAPTKQQQGFMYNTYYTVCSKCNK